jgi:hypothetical protein
MSGFYYFLQILYQSTKLQTNFFIKGIDKLIFIKVALTISQIKLNR